jgi:hypothetical protein
MALAAFPAAGQYDNSESSRQGLKWMPRRPVSQVVETPQGVVQTQAISADSEPVVEVTPQVAVPKKTRPQTRVTAQGSVQAQAKANATAQTPTSAQNRVPTVRSGATGVAQPGFVPQAGPVEYMPGSVFADEAIDSEGAAWDAGDTWGSSCDGSGRGCAPGIGLLRMLCSPNPVWGRVESMVLWSKGMHVPALVTESPVGTTGVLGGTGTEVVFGETNLTDSARWGGRWTLGRWFDPNQTTGVEISYLTTETSSDGIYAASTGNPTIARPFYDVSTGQQNSSLVAYSATGSLSNANGAIEVYARSRLDGLEANLRRALYWDSNRRLDFLFGYRNMKLKDLFTVDDATYPTSSPGTLFRMDDLIDTRNEFHGANLGFAGRVQHARWSMDLLMKLAVGNTRSRVRLDGTTTSSGINGENPTTYDSGLLVLGTNQGTISHNQFSMIPELGFNLGYDLTPRMRATAGYSLVYWSHVARATEQVSTDLNSTQFPGPNSNLTGAALPRSPFAVNDYWVQGLSVGLDIRF